MKPHTPVVTGYHGCDETLGRLLVAGEETMKPKNRSYHWLGSGVYFWENDKDRALEWAQEKASRGEIQTPFVIGGVIELGRCLDLSVRENVPLLKAAHKSLVKLYSKSGAAMPQNRKAPKDNRKDKVMRFLDCAVINHLVETSDPSFDTVRGLFVEGDRVYKGGELYHKTHVEVAVRNLSRIQGLFIPL